MRELSTDILILGSGGAGLFAALHAHKADPSLSITVAVKGLLGKCGCTRMVQGGYNVALAKEDSIERHFMDTIEGGKWLPDQELAWKLVDLAVERIHELENELGCFFDRNPDGTVHQKAFAGQTFDRTVHKGDLTGIEIINRLAEQVWARKIDRLEEHRAVELIKDKSNSAIAGVLFIDMRTGEYVLVRAKAVLLATGGGPTMYKYHTPSGDKSCDGLAMALRAGLPLRDMEMVQFHPTGLLRGHAHAHDRHGAGRGPARLGRLPAERRERALHAELRPARPSARRAISFRARCTRRCAAGNTSPNGGLYISMGASWIRTWSRKQFKGMVERCADCGFDLAGGLVEVVPTAHYMMGGVEFDADCSTELKGLFVAGEDAGGVHGANRLGGNGVANSTVFGAVAGDVMAEWVAEGGCFAGTGRGCPLRRQFERCEARKSRQPHGSLEPLRERLYDVMWQKVGIIRDAAGLRAGAVRTEVAGERTGRHRHRGRATAPST